MFDSDPLDNHVGALPVQTYRSQAHTLVFPMLKKSYRQKFARVELVNEIQKNYI